MAYKSVLGLLLIAATAWADCTVYRRVQTATIARLPKIALPPLGRLVAQQVCDCATATCDGPKDVLLRCEGPQPAVCDQSTMTDTSEGLRFDFVAQPELYCRIEPHGDADSTGVKLYPVSLEAGSAHAPQCKRCGCISSTFSAESFAVQATAVCIAVP